MPRWTLRKSGVMMAEFRVTVSIDKGSYEEMKRLAKVRDMDIKTYMRSRAADGIYRDVLDPEPEDEDDAG